MTRETDTRRRRLTPRYPLTQNVQVRSRGASPRRYPARDVSLGGFFLATEDAYELFADVELDVSLPRGRSTRLSARVVHILNAEKARSFGVAPGIGVQFEGLTDQQLGYVQELVAWARARDPRPRIARRKQDASIQSLQGQPMLRYLLDHVDGVRDPEALAEELGIEVASVERMLRELYRLGIIELVAAGSQAHVSPARAAAPVQPATTKPISAPPPASLDPKYEAQLAALEHRLAQGSLYDLLDVAETASSQAIQAGFRTQSAALRLPIGADANTTRGEHLQNRLREAYGILSSTRSRREYDEYLERGRRLAVTEPLQAAWSPTQPGAQSGPTAARERSHSQGAHERTSATRHRRVTETEPASQDAPFAAAAHVLDRAERAHAAGNLGEVGRQLELLTAMALNDANIHARTDQLKVKVAHTLAGDFERQAAYEEKQQRWARAADSWQRVAQGRPKDSEPLQRIALAKLQAGTDLQQAIEIAKRAVELAEHDPQAHRTLARVYVAAGMQAEARRELEIARSCGAARAVEAPATSGTLSKRPAASDERS